MIRSNHLVLGMAALSALSFSAFAVIEGTRVAAEARPTLLTFEADRDAGEVGPTRGLAEVAVAFRNPTGRPIRLLGADNHCGTLVCVKAEAMPLEIPPRSERRLAVKVQYLADRDPGPGLRRFREDLEIYSDNPGQARMTLTFRGSIGPASIPVPPR